MQRRFFLICSIITGTAILLSAPILAQSHQGSGKAHAHAVIRGFTSPSIMGSVNFVQKDDMSVHITGEIRGLSAGQLYAIHVHQWGDCSKPSASGGHFDPYRSGRHGNPNDPTATHHSGDLPNIKTDEEGIAQIDFSTKSLTVLPSHFSVLGHAVVVHEHADDYSSQPAGNAGTRIACGVIGLIKE